MSWYMRQGNDKRLQYFAHKRRYIGQLFLMTLYDVDCFDEATFVIFRCRRCRCCTHVLFAIVYCLRAINRVYDGRQNGLDYFVYNLKRVRVVLARQLIAHKHEHDEDMLEHFVRKYGRYLA